MTEINQRVKGIAAQIKACAAISNDFLGLAIDTNENNTDNSHINFKVDYCIYESNLPKGITLETIKQLKEYNDDFEAGVLLGVGHLTLDAIKDKPEITSSTALIKREPDSFVSARISIDDDNKHHVKILSFGSHVKEAMPMERVTGEMTQKQIVQKNLLRLYNDALTAVTN